MSYIKWHEFDTVWFNKLPVQIRKKGNKGYKGKQPLYKDIVTAFDIETTRIPEIDQAVMYIWQWQIGNDCTVIGRTWSEFISFLKLLNITLEAQDATLVCFVHNLGHEFQFISGLLDFKPDDVFAVESRRVLKATYQHIEFRCSYLQTNMSLRAFCEKMKVKSYKLRLDYNKPRYWYTPLSDKEMAYCLNDVRGLVQAIQAEMERDGDTLATLPLTSTGYARRDMKKVMSKVSHNLIASLQPTYEIYELEREAFRGGNTHANRYYSGVKITEEYFGSKIYTEDISSSYPTEICMSQFPMSSFFIKKSCTFEELEDLIFKKGKAVICRCRLENVKLRDPTWPVPYLAIAKCHGMVNIKKDNGRILSADRIEEVTLTDIDLRMLVNEYECKITPLKVAYARYGYLPEQFRKLVFSYFQDKTDLKDKPGDDEHTADFYELLYNKLKNLLNAQYGMLAQDPVKFSIKYVNELADLFLPDTSVTAEDLLEKHNRKSLIAYQWGCWVTSWARFHLEEGIKLIHETPGAAFLYCDTDSCKYFGQVDWEKINGPRREKAEKLGYVATDPNGIKHYMGLFEHEKKSDAVEFKTLGAKKYAYRTTDGKLHITIAGVNKKIGAIELERAGGIDSMDRHFRFNYAGGLEAKYNDHPDITSWVTKDGVTIKITRNVCLVPTTKTIGAGAAYDEYMAMVQECRSMNIDQ